MSSNQKKIIFMKTPFVVPFKTMIEVLSNVLTETTWVFVPPNPNDANAFSGLEIAISDSTRTIFIRVKLNGFEEFVCNRTKPFEIGINLQNLYKLIKTVDKDDIMSLYVLESDKQNLVIEIENQEKNSKTFNKLHLYDLNYTSKKPQNIEFDVGITMQSTEFHKICKEMNTIAEYIDIRCTDKNIAFSCKGDCSERTTFYKSGGGSGLKIESTDNTQKDQQDQQDQQDQTEQQDQTDLEENPKKVQQKKTNIVQGIYELKNIVLFTKCSNLCNEINIYMKNDFPLTINYTVATLGSITIALSPIKEETINNFASDSDSESDSDSDDELEAIL